MIRNKIKTIDSWWVFLIATAFLGPFALPLLWRNPNWSKRTKVICSGLVILLTLLLVYSLTFLKSHLEELQIEMS
ncbi:hypothetical protein EBT16_04910 [bacterium]|nr:hypothetical protein [bacterium]